MRKKKPDGLGTISLLTSFWRGFDVEGPAEGQVVLEALLDHAGDVDPDQCVVCGYMEHVEDCWFATIISMSGEEREQLAGVLAAAIAEEHGIAENLAVSKTALARTGHSMASSGVAPDDPIAIPRGAELALSAPRMESLIADANRRVAVHRDLLVKLRDQTGLIYSTDLNQFIPDPTWKTPSVAERVWTAAESQGGSAWMRVVDEIERGLANAKNVIAESVASIKWLHEKGTTDAMALEVLIEMAPASVASETTTAFRDAFTWAKKSKDPRVATLGERGLVALGG